MSAHLDQDEAPDYLDHYTLEFRDSAIGPFSVQVWQASLQADERFSVVHLVPTNDRTRTRLASTCTRTGQRPAARPAAASGPARSEEHKSELQSLMRNSYAVFCLTNKNKHHRT